MFEKIAVSSSVGSVLSPFLIDDSVKCGLYFKVCNSLMYSFFSSKKGKLSSLKNAKTIVSFLFILL